MNKQERIEKLKNPKQAQAYGIYLHDKPELARIIDRTDNQNLLILTCAGTWDNVARIALIVPNNTYILKPEYDPKPELSSNRKLAIKIAEELYTMGGAGPCGEPIIVGRIALMKLQPSGREEMLGGLCIASAKTFIEKILDDAVKE